MISDWVNDRIRFGLWVSPSDEVKQLASNSVTIHTSLDFLAACSTHPFPDHFSGPYLDPKKAVSDFVGYISLEPRHEELGIKDPFLPPKRLLNELDLVYSRKLRSRIWDVLLEIVAATAIARVDEEEAEQYLASWGPREMLSMLRNQVTWIPGLLAEQAGRIRLKKLRGQQKEVKDQPKETREERRSSPGVVAVEDEEMIELDYGIKEVASSAASPDSEEEEIGGTNRSVPIVHHADTQTRLKPHSSAKIDIALNKPIDLPTPDTSPALGKRKIPPAPEYEHMRNEPPSQKAVPVASCDLNAARRAFPPPVHTVRLRPRDNAISSQPSAPTSDTTNSSISTGPFPIPPDNPDADTLIDEKKTAWTTNDDSDEYSDVTDSRSFHTSDSPRSVRSELHEPNVPPNLDLIPWIPSEKHELGPMTDHILMSAWHDARAKLTECKCAVCARARKRTFEAWAWPWAVAGDGGKRLRIG